MDAQLILKTKKGTREIVERIISLPLEEQERIACNIFYNVRNAVVREGRFNKRIERGVPQEKFDAYLRIAGEVVGCEINLKCKRRDMVLGRVFIIAQLYREGYAISKIAERVQKQRDVVSYNLDKYEDLLKYPNVFHEEIELWNRFQEKIKGVTIINV